MHSSKIKIIPFLSQIDLISWRKLFFGLKFLDTSILIAPISWFLKILFIVFVSIVISIITITTYFANDIEDSIVKTIEKNLYEPLILDDVEFTIYDNFPFASVKINNLFLKESRNFDDDTLLFTERAYIELSLIDIFNKNYDIKNIIVTDATINFKYNDLNEPNFQIFRKNDSKNNVSIKKITLLNSKLKIQKSLTKLDLNWLINRAIIDIDANNYKFVTDCFSKKLVVGETDYLNQKNINFNCSSDITKGIVDIINSLI